MEHERLVHRRVWQCFNHADAVFTSSAELRGHLQSRHSEDITEAQIQSLLDICDSSVADTRAKCPICLIEGPFEKGINNHLSFHLETLATFSIPRAAFSGEESVLKTDGNPPSSQETQGLRSENSMESISLNFQSPPASTSSLVNEQREEETSSKRGAPTSQNDENPAPGDLEELFCWPGQAVTATPIDRPDSAGKLNRSGDDLLKRYLWTGDLKELEKAIEASLQAVQVMPSDYVDRAEYLSNLGAQLGFRFKRTRNAKDLEGAINVARQAVEITPENHPSFAAYLCNLGIQLCHQFQKPKEIHDPDPDEADLMVRRAVEVTPEDVPHLVGRLSGFESACSHADSKNLDEAEEIYQRALKIHENVAGQTHLSTLNTVKNLGNIYVGQGKLDEAEKMYKRARRGYEKILGAEDIMVLVTVENLGALYSDQGKLDEAAKMFECTLQGYKKTLGAKHTRTLEMVKDLDVVYFDQGRDLWGLALERLSLKDKNAVGEIMPDSKLDILPHLHTVAVNQRNVCEGRRWKFELNGQSITLRDVANHIIVCVDKYKQIRDVVENSVSSPSSLPWAGIRFFLEVGFNDHTEKESLNRC